MGINQGKKSKEQSKPSTVNDFNDVSVTPVQANIASLKTSAPSRFQVPSSPSTGGPSRFHQFPVSRFHHSPVQRYHHSAVPRFQQSLVPRFPPPSPRTLIRR